MCNIRYLRYKSAEVRKLLAADRMASGRLPEVDIEQSLPPYSGALIKNEADYEMLEAIRRRFRR